MKSLRFDADIFDSAESFLRSDRRKLTSCLIADVQMPGTIGLERHDRLASPEKPVPTMLMMAYPNDQIWTRMLRTGIRCLLANPFADEELLGCIHRTLGDGAGN